MMGKDLVAREVFFTNGVGRHKHKLQSFELALRDAGIQMCNLVSVSSIIPPNCKLISRNKGLKELKPGQITFVVMARNESDEDNRLISSAVGVALPSDINQYGYLSEHHGFGETEKEAGEYAEDLAATMLASTLGIEFDVNKAYDERKDIYKLSGKIVRTRSVSQTAICKKGVWTTVVTAAVFII